MNITAKVRFYGAQGETSPSLYIYNKYDIDAENIEKIEQVLVQIRGKKICIITHLISETLKKHAVSVWEMERA